MARKRLIDTENLFFDTEIIYALTLKGILAYIRLWGIAEDWGGFELNYQQIKLKMGAVKIKTEEVKKEIEKLIEPSLGKIIPYEINGRKYAWIKNLLKHQELSNAAAPSLPLPEWIEYEIKEYPSRKKYAVYKVIPQKLPEAYQKPTRNTETIPNYTIPIETIPIETIQKIVEDLNAVLGTNYKPTTAKTKEFIETRISEGFGLEDFKVVHRKMLKAWGADNKMAQFLRPITLYSPKFEGYLNRKEVSTKLTETGIKAYLIGQEWLKNQQEKDNAK